MEAITLKLPDTLAENTLLRLPASWEDYLDLADDTSYTVQFLNNEIILSQATASHEALVMMIGWLLTNHYIDDVNYKVLGSNVKIVIPGQAGDFNADVSVVQEPVAYGVAPGGQLTAVRIQNPVLIVEVLSKGTRKFDMGEKLSYYKLIPSLQHILFVDQERPFASVYTRTETPDEWLNHDYRTLESIVRLGDLKLPLQAIYRKTVFNV